MLVWVLTTEHNEYDQFGEYFVAVFLNKPTPIELEWYGISVEDIPHVQNGGGRQSHENQWWHLKSHEIK